MYYASLAEEVFPDDENSQENSAKVDCASKKTK
jgi:hypothetical protein